MATILGANTLSSGYDVANSLRLNSGDSAQMNKTLGTATDVDKYTISMWVVVWVFATTVNNLLILPIMRVR